MIPTVCLHRYDQPGALWSNKLSGDFAEGDPLVTRFFVEGRVEIKQLGGRLRAFFKNILLKPRLVKKDEVKAEKADDDTSDDSSTDSKPKEAQVEEEIVLPKLAIYLTVKKPKKRMVDAHKLGTRIFLTNYPEGVFGELGVSKSYEAGLMDIADMSNFQGLVIMKLPSDEPMTGEPVIYGYVRLLSSRSIRIRTLDSIHLHDLNDLVDKLILKEKAGAALLSLGPEARKHLKSLKYYRQLANKAWYESKKAPDELVDFADTLAILSKLDMFLLKAQAKRLFDAVDVAKAGKLGISELENLLIAKDLVGQLSSEIVALDVFDTLKGRPYIDKGGQVIEGGGKEEGIDYAAFKEVLEVLGYRPPPIAKDMDKAAADEELEVFIRTAFCFGGGIKEKDADSKHLSLQEMRKGWLKVTDLPAQMALRGIRAEAGLFTETRNRERLSRSIAETETNYLLVLRKLHAFIEDIKIQHRVKRDERRREKEAHKEKLLHEANKFIAKRGAEKRLQIQKQQEEKTKKRVEEKILKNKLLLQQKENNLRAADEIKRTNAAKQVLKAAEIRRLGLDVIDRSLSSLREVPKALYSGAAAQNSLTYALWMDFSRNKIDVLPANEQFFYWCNDVKKVKFSENRLRSLPADFTSMTAVEILELDKNHLQSLPPTLGAFVNLQRLDIANNSLQALPESIGSCMVLKYLNAHSNQLLALPTALGQCYKLEYLNLSCNQLKELPEDLEHLVSLTHLDISSNEISYLMHNIGSLLHLSYLDVNTNLLSALPSSFSQLAQLEYCNLENNALISLLACFSQLVELKYLNLRKNRIHVLSKDIGSCASLTFLDLSVNRLPALPIEVGLLVHLIELQLAYNDLVTLPAELGACRKLIKLVLHHNHIAGALPATLSLIRSLEELDLSDNAIDSIPESIVGFQELVKLSVNRCQLTQLPQQIVLLPKLSVLEVSSNRLRAFPMHLQHMPWLQELDLSNNSIALLPRRIRHMSFLHALNLRNNQLQALPVEFVEVFESVASVQLEHNPWTLLPNKWGMQRVDPRGPSHAANNSKGYGYSLQGALDFLYAVGTFYYKAEDVWRDYGVFYHTNRLGLADFISEVKGRVPNLWHDGLLKYAEHVYFTSKETGMFMRWYEEADGQQLLAAEQHYAELNAQRKHGNVLRSRQDLAQRAQQMVAAYDVDLPRRVRQAQQLIDENNKNAEYIENVQLQALSAAVQEKAKQHAVKAKAKEAGQERLRKQELARMFDILNQDKPVRQAEKERSKQVEARR